MSPSKPDAFHKIAAITGVAVCLYVLILNSNISINHKAITISAITIASLSVVGYVFIVDVVKPGLLSDRVVPTPINTQQTIMVTVPGQAPSCSGPSRLKPNE
jgi:hypothetical protein